MKFVKAEKKKSKLRLGMSGPSGSGKTYSALRLAKGLGGKVAVIDTERGSASLYADKFEFDVLELTAPYTTERYIEAMKLAKDYDIIIIYPHKTTAQRTREDLLSTLKMFGLEYVSNRTESKSHVEDQKQVDQFRYKEDYRIDVFFLS